MTLRRRLTLGSSVVVASVLVLVAAMVYLAVRDQVRGQIDGQLRGRAQVIVPSVEARAPEAIPEPPIGRPAGYFQIVDADGATRRPGNRGAALPVSAETIAAATGRGRAFLSDVTVEGVPLRMLVTPLERGGAVQLALPLDQVNDLLGWLRWAIILAGAGGVALTALISGAVTRAALTPLSTLIGTAEEVTRTSDLGQRIAHSGQDEVGRLAETFNTMLSTLEASQDAQRHLVIDASHELRTPLTAIRTNIDILSEEDDQLSADDRADLLAVVRGQLDELTHLVSDVVELARGAEQHGERTRHRLDELVMRCIQRARLLAPSATIHVTVEPAEIDAVVPQLERAVSNLLDNAIKWSPPGGAIEVTVRPGEVTVRDHGPGIAAKDLPHVFDRFYRGETARPMPGSGLGLAIVRQAADAHSGTIAAERPSGGGTLLRLTLPHLLTGGGEGRPA